MALINGNEYDHIDFTKNGVTTRHMLKDALSRQMSGDLVKVQNEEPTSEGTKIWIKPSGDSEVQVPTYEEFEELSGKIDGADATITSLAVGAQPTVSVTEVDGHKRFSFGIPASNGIASITKTATDGVIDTYTIAMTDGTSTSFSVNNSDITPESMAEAIATALQDYARIDGYYPDLTAGNADQLNSTKFVEDQEPYLYRPSGGTSDIGNRKYLDAIVGVSLPWNQMVRDEVSENQTDFAPIVTVTDAVEDAAGVKVQIEPVQDLHGYDHPWPAGGGKNKCPEQWEPGMYDVTNGAKKNGTNYIRSTTMFPVLPETSYCYVKPSGNATRILFYDSNGDFISAPDLIFTNHTSDVFTTPQGAYFMTTYTAETSYENDVAINYPSSVATYTPYSNICPIAGWDGVQVWDDPKYGGLIKWNQRIEYAQNDGWTSAATSDFFEDIDTRTVSATMTVASSRVKKQSMPTVKNHVYCLSAQITVSVNNEVRVELSRGWTQAPFSLSANRETLCQTVLTPTAENDNYEWVQFYVSNIGTYPCTLQVRDAMLLDLTEMFGAGNEPTTVEEFKTLFPADYYPYNAGEVTTVSAVNGDPYRRYSITLPTEAGTVYGGTLDVSTGELVVDRVNVVVDDAALKRNPANWYDVDTSNNRNSFGIYFYWNDLWLTTVFPLPDTNKRLMAITDSFVNAGGLGVYNNDLAGYFYIHQASPIYFGFRISSKVLADTSSAEAVSVSAMAYLHDHPIQLCYYIAEPITYTLTASQIRTLLGENNIWADTGDLALTYTGTDEHLTLESGKKYLARINGTDSMLLGSAQEITAAKGTDNVFDLTKMFGISVADYVYGQGASFFRRWFPNAVYPYNAGELKHVEGLQSHDMVGFNAWDEEWESGMIDTTTGAPSASQNRIRSKNFIPVLPSTTYFLRNGSGTTPCVFFYDASMNFISYFNVVANSSFTTLPNAQYIKFFLQTDYGTTYKHDICINLSHSGARNGEYEPYEKHSYPLDSTVVLRGIPKVDANGVYWDGDRYLPDGTVERRYGVVNMGTLLWSDNDNKCWVTNAIPGIKPVTDSPYANRQQGVICTKYPADTQFAISGTAMTDKTWLRTGTTFAVKDTAYENVAAFKAAMSGVYLVYELATPTTETAQPYRSTQWVSDWGTEEFVSTGIVPVGTETRYPANLRDKLQHLPDAASSNGSYLITQTDGQMTLTPFPAPPTTAGKYVLRATVTNGVATFSWEATT